jgi:conjugative transfer region protein TrbK
MTNLGRATGYVALAAALLAAAITFNVGKYPREEASSLELSAAVSDLDSELARCKKIGPETVDAACLVIWEANRSRFFRTGKSYQDRMRDIVPDKPDSKDEQVPAHGALSDVHSRSPADGSSHSPVDSTGRLK